jgi:hypothetical protein
MVRDLGYAMRCNGWGLGSFPGVTFTYGHETRMMDERKGGFTWIWWGGSITTILTTD